MRMCNNSCKDSCTIRIYLLRWCTLFRIKHVCVKVVSDLIVFFPYALGWFWMDLTVCKREYSLLIILEQLCFYIYNVWTGYFFYLHVSIFITCYLTLRQLSCWNHTKWRCLLIQRSVYHWNRLFIYLLFVLYNLFSRCSLNLRILWLHWENALLNSLI